jgi:NAD-dependent deacetylase
VEGLAEARALLGGARVISVLTGAGISTASGIPDFRGPEGIWTKDPAAEMLSTYDVWVADPEVRRRAWRRRVETRGERPAPNDGHRALVTLERTGRLDTLVTQNIDGLHADAGNDPGRIVEIHGSSRDAVCLSCGDRGPIDRVLERVAEGDEVPVCLAGVGRSACGGILKSATISFGQSLVEADLARAEAAASRCELLLAVGSTLSVWPIAGMVPLAHASGAAIIVVNGGPTAMDELTTVRLGGAIESALPRLVDDLPAI